MPVNILIADDNCEKAEVIASAVASEFLGCTIEHSRSFNSTMKKLKSTVFDIILLDMSMPTFDDVEGNSSAIKPLAGRDVLSKLKYRKSPQKVIVVTQFDVFGRMTDTVSLKDLEENLHEQFPTNFLGCVYYDPRSSSWVEQLSKFIKESVVDG